MNKKDEILLKTKVEILSKKLQVQSDLIDEKNDKIEELHNKYQLLVEENLLLKKELGRITESLEKEEKSSIVKLDYLSTEKKNLEKKLAKFKKQCAKLEYMNSVSTLPFNSSKKGKFKEMQFDDLQIEEIENEMENLYRIIEEKEKEIKQLKGLMLGNKRGNNSSDLIEENLTMRKEILHMNEFLRSQEGKINDLQWENKRLQHSLQKENLEYLQSPSKGNLLSYKDSNEVSMLKKSLKEAIEKCGKLVLSEKDLRKKLEEKDEQMRASKSQIFTLQKTLSGQIAYLSFVSLM